MQIQSLILDFGQVLCSYTLPKNSPVPPKLLKQLMTSDTWLQYESGHYSEDECYSRLGDHFDVSPSDIAASLEQIRQSLQVHHLMLDAVKETTRLYGLKVYGMTNTPFPERDTLRCVTDEYNIFEDVYISGTLGMRKPEPRFYETVLERIGLPAEATIFVDDNLANVQTAKSIKMHGLVFSTVEDFVAKVHSLMGGCAAGVVL